MGELRGIVKTEKIRTAQKSKRVRRILKQKIRAAATAQSVDKAFRYTGDSVNGVSRTTTIRKHISAEERGKSVLLAAADTFRAAAANQLAIWARCARRKGAPRRGNPAAVVFDSIKAALRNVA